MLNRKSSNSNNSSSSQQLSETKTIVDYSTLTETELLNKAKGGFFSKGDALAQYELAMRSHKKVIRYYDRTSELLDEESSTTSYRSSYANPSDIKNAFDWFHKAGEQEHAASQYWVGYYYGRIGPEINVQKAKKWLERAALQNHANAPYQLSLFYHNQKEDQTLRFKWLNKAAELEQIDAQIELVNCYKHGIGTDKDINLAATVAKGLRVNKLKQDAKRGEADAQADLGFQCLALKEDEKAIEWFNKAAKKSNANAAYGLGVCYSQGRGVTKDMVTGLKWYETAVEKGHYAAKKILTQAYVNAIDNKTDEKAMTNLLKMKGVKQNSLSAHHLESDLLVKILSQDNTITTLDFSSDYGPKTEHTIVLKVNIDPSFTVSNISIYGSLLAASSATGNIGIFDIDTGYCKHLLVDDAEAAELVFLNEDRLVSSSGKTLKLWSISQEKCLYTVEHYGGSFLAKLGSNQLVSSLASGNDNYQPSVSIWKWDDTLYKSASFGLDFNKEKESTTLTQNQTSNYQVNYVTYESTLYNWYSCNALTTTSDGTLVIAYTLAVSDNYYGLSGYTYRLGFWNSSGTLLKTLPTSDAITQLNMLPNGFLAGVFFGGSCGLWNPYTQQSVQSFSSRKDFLSYWAQQTSYYSWYNPLALDRNTFLLPDLTYIQVINGYNYGYIQIKRDYQEITLTHLLRIFERLKAHPAIQTLSITSLPINDKAIEAFINLCAENETITSLKLSSNISSQDIAKFSTALQARPTRLTINSTNIASGYQPSSAIEKYVTWLKKKAQLTTNQTVIAKTQQQLAAILCQQGTYYESKQNLPDAAKWYLDAAQQNSYEAKQALDRLFKDPVSKYVREASEAKTTSLDLSQELILQDYQYQKVRQLKGSDLSLLFQALQNNQTVELLNLSNCGALDIQVLQLLMMQNKSITKLNLTNTGTSSTNITTLKSKLQDRLTPLQIIHESVSSPIVVATTVSQQGYHERQLRWLTQKAEFGILETQLLLAASYEKGTEIINKDYKQAAKWYLIAAKQNSYQAKQALDRLFKDPVSKYVRAASEAKTTNLDLSHELILQDSQYEKVSPLQGENLMALFEELQDNKVVQKFNLSYCQNLNCKALLFLLLENESITELNLSQTGISTNDITTLQTHLTNRLTPLCIIHESNQYPIIIASASNNQNELVAKNLRWLHKKAELGYTDIQHQLANYYELGKNVAQSNRKAADWYLKAAKQNHTPSMEALNRLFKDPIAKYISLITKQKVTTVDLSQELILTDKNYQNLSQLNVRQLTENDLEQFFTVLLNDKQIHTLNLANCQQLNATKMIYFLATNNHLTSINLSYTGITKNNINDFKTNLCERIVPLQIIHESASQSIVIAAEVKNEDKTAKSLRWLYQKAKLGFVQDQLELAQCYQAGQLIPQSNQECAYWYLKAAAQNDQTAKTALDQLFKNPLAKYIEKIKNNILEKLDLSQELILQGNDYKNVRSLKFQDLPTLLGALQINKSVKVVSFENCELGNAAIMSIEAMLEGNLEITEINLTHTTLTNQDIYQLKAGLKTRLTPLKIIHESSTIPIIISLGTRSNKTDVQTQEKTLIVSEQKNTEKTEQKKVTEISISYHINHTELVYGKKLGQGGFGTVYQGTWRNDVIAIKQLLLSNLSEEASEEFKNEAEVMMKLRSNYLIRFFGYCPNPNNCLVMEYMPKGSLYAVLHSKQKLTWNTRYEIATDIACGLASLHKENILHRDIKSHNVLLTNDWRAKLTDFGLSKVKSESKTSTKGSAGTTQWKAPELFKRGAKHSEKTDIYSMGITFWEIVTRQIPYDDVEDLSTVPSLVTSGERPQVEEGKPFPKDCPKKFASLIKFCWQSEANKRPTADQVVQYLKTEKEDNFEQFASSYVSNTYSASPSSTSSNSSTSSASATSASRDHASNTYSK